MRVNPFLPANAGNATSKKGDRDQRDPGRVPRSMVDTVLQTLIAVLTLSGLYMFGDRDASVSWFGAWISLAAQPAWLADSWRSRKAGNFLVSLAMTAIFLRAIYVGW